MFFSKGNLIKENDKKTKFKKNARSLRNARETENLEKIFYLKNKNKILMKKKIEKEEILIILKANKRKVFSMIHENTGMIYSWNIQFHIFCPFFVF